ncbi:MBL fold metallo-hydrolase [Reyranella soli]|uniref:Metallo-beta-lactamase domain-containing protein n=1 Tax=Reyranella soli TaxID=1230389 RepID=A0A512NQE6_9HYPH|nr:MBL fold metallo-hydrolase [Reyranella soli]GEP61173.1 hypothetical protein RSO01_83390 [Reyranella soli]
MTQSQVTIRHYCQGIGDCHLLTFTRVDGSAFRMLIDCGVHTSVPGGSNKIDEIVADIAEETGSHLDVIVATHEHADHLSGFSSAADKFAKFTVGEIWMGWTEDPADKQAGELDKYKDQGFTALQLASDALGLAERSLTPSLGMVRRGLAPLLEFQFGAKGDRVRAMRDHLVALAPKDVRYFEPTDRPIEIAGLPNLRVYVLGPPRDPALIKVVERASEMYGLADGGSPIAQALLNGFAVRDGALGLADDYAAPFDGVVGLPLSELTGPNAAGALANLEPDVAKLVTDHYLGPARGPGCTYSNQDWRRIDLDWLMAGAGLGMQLDAKTNNTSLVLAFEFVDTGRILLFTGDAQVGNWLGWKDLKWQVDGKTVTGPDLLARTVYYKVGHHGSENATLKQKGLELMTQADLSAFVPTNQNDAQRVKWGAMPFKPILDELERRSAGRVIRADDEWVQSSPSIAPRFAKPSGSIKRVKHRPKLWVELDVA